MSDTTLRQIAMLREIPGKPGKISPSKLHQRLLAEGFVVDKRSVERDLNKLSRDFALVSDGAKPAGWSWSDAGDPLQFPAMNLSVALTWQLLDRYLTPLLPLSLLRDLKSQFEQSRKTLQQLHGTPLGHWSPRVAAIASGLQLVAPKIREDVRGVVNEALLRDRQFQVTYLALESNDAQSLRLHPLGLVLRGGVLYLIATAYDYTDPRQWALHRMSKASLLEDPAAKPKDFDFERYVHEMRGFDFPTGKKIRLELDVEPWLARHLSESRLSADQTIKPLTGGKRSRVSATVMESQQLEWWLRSLGSHVTVVSPTALRNRIVAEARAVASAGSKVGRGRGGVRKRT